MCVCLCLCISVSVCGPPNSASLADRFEWHGAIVAWRWLWLCLWMWVWLWLRMWMWVWWSCVCGGFVGVGVGVSMGVGVGVGMGVGMGVGVGVGVGVSGDRVRRPRTVSSSRVDRAAARAPNPAPGLTQHLARAWPDQTPAAVVAPGSAGRAWGPPACWPAQVPSCRTTAPVRCMQCRCRRLAGQERREEERREQKRTEENRREQNRIEEKRREKREERCAGSHNCVNCNMEGSGNRGCARHTGWARQVWQMRAQTQLPTPSEGGGRESTSERAKRGLRQRSRHEPSPSRSPM